MSTGVIMTLIICITIVLLCSIEKFGNVMSSKYDHENIIKSESEEK